jgi:hypothetical protein
MVFELLESAREGAVDTEAAAVVTAAALDESTPTTGLGVGILWKLLEAAFAVGLLAGREEGGGKGELLPVRSRRGGLS